MDVVSQNERGGLEFNWTALSVFLASVVLIVSAETFIYTSVLKEHIAVLGRDVAKADAALERRIVASEVVHLDIQRQIDRQGSEIEKLRQMDDQIRRDNETLMRDLTRRKEREGR